MKNKEGENHYVADIIAEKYGMSRRSVYRAAEFARAVNILANEYGLDIRDHILNRDVKLTHAQTVRFAGIVQSAPGAFLWMGEFIRAGNTQIVKRFINGDVGKDRRRGGTFE